MPELALGTVAFGGDYGITNAGGTPADADIESILSQAINRGVVTFDTAQDYGTSQARLGRLMPADANARYITKFSLPTDGSHPTRENLFASSMSTLRVQRLEGVIFHKFSDLHDRRGLLAADILRESRDAKLINHAGVSVYNERELEFALSVFPDLDIIQVPANVLDSTLISSPLVTELHSRGVHIHVRSAFLQGLVFADPLVLPEFFAPLAPALTAIRAEARRSQTTVQALALGALKFHPNVDVVVVGTLSSHELIELLEAWNSATQPPPLDFGEVPARVLDPREWPQTKVST